MTSSRSSLARLRRELRALGSKEKAAHSVKFMRAYPGGYGEGDLFLGVTVPQVRSILKRFKDLNFEDFDRLFASDYHEERLLASIWFSNRAMRADLRERRKLYKAYLAHLRAGHVNNWDIIDGSAPQVVGGFLFHAEDLEPARRLSRSKKLWDRRVAMMLTYYFIRYENVFAPTLEIADALLHDQHDLIQKAVGWMLREVGNRDGPLERTFLKTRYKNMPRTMLRYAIEKFPAAERKRYLQGAI